ncbi:XRE family transcriptional regulator [Dyadobacter psychrotolerans]|uniref:LexA family transcriptional regulator n=1 Tax=Dyadobacter psychrotolerans TaxID=2541721 RepID=A0A4R5DUB5_9BACT|nr:LexA family transcriptional regulator [Dyadobacter psychrotolerans]TDE18082.1 LexA family transcriptional regulator [Dyadobacter psychrotolerans]
MNSQRIFFSGNIKFLRERKNLSQETLAEKLGLTRSKLNALENGHTKAPQPDDYLNYSMYFKISVDNLLKVDLSKLSELKLRDLEAGNDVYMTGSNIRILAITVDKGNKENVEYVPVKAKAGYRSGYADPQYLAKLPKFSMPNLPRDKTYRIFPTEGDSMLPIPEDSDITCMFVQDWKSIKPQTPCIVVLSGEKDFVFKQVTVNDDATILLSSYNCIYDPYTVSAEEVLEIWEFYSFQSKEIPNIEGNDQIMKVLLDVQKQVTELVGNK